MKHAKPKNVHPLLPKRYTFEERLDKWQIVKRNIYYVPLPFNLGLVKYPFAWRKPKSGAYGTTAIEVTQRYWALYNWADHADLDERCDYILNNIRERRNGSVRVK